MTSRAPADETRPAGDGPGDRRLAERCIAGDARAWQDLVARHAPNLAARVGHVYLRRAGRRPDPRKVEEIVQDVFVKLARDRCRALRNFRWESSLATYLAAMAVSLTVDRIRSEAAERTRWGVRRDLLGADGLADPAGSLADAETSGRVRTALAALPERTRLAVEMRYWGGLSTLQIGKSLGVTDRYVRDLLAAATETLKRSLKGEA